MLYTIGSWIANQQGHSVCCGDRSLAEPEESEDSLAFQENSVVVQEVVERSCVKIAWLICTMLKY
jgi:hypothetical protein